MWWCCGKTNPEAPGCKYSKHFSKNEDEDEKDPAFEDEVGKLKALKCYCCKEKGHKTENCPKDPNFRHNQDADKESLRIMEIKEKKKLLADSVAVQNKIMEAFSKKKLQHIFGQDIMSFDDFNYGLLNDYIFNVVRSLHSDDDYS